MRMAAISRRGCFLSPLPRWSALLLLLLLLVCAGARSSRANDDDDHGLPLAAAPSNCTAAAGSCVRVGYFSCPASDPKCAQVIAHDALQRWYRERIANKFGGRLAGAPVRWVKARLSGFFSFTAAEVYGTVDRLFIGDAARNGTGPPLVDFVILPLGSSWTTAMTLLEAHRIPAVSSLSPDRRLFQCAPTANVWTTQLGCTAPNTRRFQYAHGASNPGEQYLEPWVGLLKLRKATSLAMLHVNRSFYLGVRDGVAAAALDNGIPLVLDRLVEYNGTVLEQRTVDNVMHELQSLPSQPDAVALVVNDCVPWVEAFRDADYSPKSVAAVLCVDTSEVLKRLGNDLNFIVGGSQWSVEMTGSEVTESADTQPWSLFPHERGGLSVGLSSPLQFQSLLRSLTNSSTLIASYGEAAVLPAYSMLEAAVTLAGTVDPEKVQAQLKVLWQTSYYGLLTTNRFGQNQQKQLVLSQRDSNGDLHIISPTSVSTHDFVYPMPRFSERNYRPAFFSSPIERVLLALIAFCCLFTGGLMAYLFHHRRRQVFQAAGLRWYLLQGLGCLMAYLSVLTWGVENNAASCGARIWVWTGAFHLFVDPMLASSYRISRIFSFQLALGRISNAQLGMVCVALATPQLLLNILWQAIAPLEPQVVTADPLRPAFTSFTTCSSGPGGLVLAALTLIYSGLLLFAACTLAFKVRRALKLFNDARPIAVSMYLFSMTAVVVLVVQETVNHPHVADQRVLFGLRSIGLLIAYQGSIGLLYLRRIIDVLVGAYRGGKAFATVTNASLPLKAAALSVSPQTLLAPDGAFAPALVMRPEPVAALASAPAHDHAVDPILASTAGTVAEAPGSVETATRHGHLSTPERTPGSIQLLTSADADVGAGVSALALSDRMQALASAEGPFPSPRTLMQLGRDECVMLLEQYHAIIQHLRAQVQLRAGPAAAAAPVPVASPASAPAAVPAAPLVAFEAPARRPSPVRIASLPMSPVLVVRGLVYPTTRPGGLGGDDGSDDFAAAGGRSYPSSSHAQRGGDAVHSELSIGRFDEQSPSQLPGMATTSILPADENTSAMAAPHPHQPLPLPPVLSLDPSAPLASPPLSSSRSASPRVLTPTPRSPATLVAPAAAVTLDH